MSIYYALWGDNNTASTRLRVMNIVPYLKGVEQGLPEKFKKRDVLIIQKTPAIDELRRAKKEGAKVIYDLDDWYVEKKEFKQMVEEADMVTVDTQEKANFLWQMNDNIEVIPDSLDWDGTVKKDYKGKKIIGWTGYGNNSTYLNDIALPKDSSLRLVTDISWMQHYKGIAQSRPWSIKMVDKYLSECDLGIYYLPEGKFEQVKGMHKLLKNMAIGLPTYTSPMPDYVKAFKEAGLGEKYIVKSDKDWKDLDFTPDYEDIDKARAYALTYSAENMSKLWQKVIKDVLLG